jgi:hypothetical protein
MDPSKRKPMWNNLWALKMVLGLVRRIPHSSLEKIGKDLFICQIYVDDIIFGSTNASFCEEFSKIMTDRFEMSMMGELKYFLGFQIKQLEDDTFISQTKYTFDLLKKFAMDKVSYPIFMSKPSTHHMHDPGSIVPHIRPKVLTDNQISRIKYNYYISNVSKDYDDSIK